MVRVNLDLLSLGYNKLLGGGKITGAFAVRVAKISNKAKEKIESVGGEVILLMNTTKTDSILRQTIKKVSGYIPQVEKPKKKITLTEKLIWSGIAVFAYLVMGQISTLRCY